MGDPLIVGIGCRAGTDAETLGRHLAAVLALHNLALDDVAAVVSIDRRAAEISALGRHLGVPVRLHPAETLEAQPVPHPSERVAGWIRTPSVAEAAVLAEQAVLLVHKHSHATSTIAIGRRNKEGHP